MFMDSIASASPSRRSTAKTPRGKRSAEFIERLRLMVRQHRVCYEIWPLWSIAPRVRKGIGFELLLCGVNGHVIEEGGALHAVPSCEHCAQTFDELREIAEWALLLKRPPLAYDIQSFDHALHLAPPNRQNRNEIIITISVVHQTLSEGDCLKEVRERLAMLGIREDVWSAQVAANA
jgi:hypothetical protein